MSVTIDASVFVAAALSEDKFHYECRNFLAEIRLVQETLYAPVLFAG